MNDELSTWHVQINGGPEQVFETKTGQYNLAAMTALALLDYERDDDYDVVKIWVPHLIVSGEHGTSYGPYFYAFDGHQLGRPEDHRKF